MNILENHIARRRLGWRDLFRRTPQPTAAELAVSSLETCRAEYLHHAEEAEKHAALRDMLRKREARLHAELERLTALPDPQKGE